MKTLTKEEVHQMISLGQPVTNSLIQNLDLYNKSLFEGEQVKTPVIFEACSLSNIDFTIHEFYNNFYFDCGGHNENPYPVKINQTVFNGFFDFFDSWFIGPVEITNCSFGAGTNFLCDMNAFDIPPLLENNSGNLHLENERGF